MPAFFPFTQGSESRVRPNSDASPLLGRYRAVPTAQQQSIGRRSSRRGLFGRRSSAAAAAAASQQQYGSLRVGYGAAILDGGGVDDDDDDDDDLDDLDASRWARLWRRWVLDLWVRPRAGAVKRAADHWYSRYGLLVFLPALLVGSPFTATTYIPAAPVC